MMVIEQIHGYERLLRTRLPFRYGIAVMTQVPHVWLELEAQIDGRRAQGWSADHLPPKWFTKDPARPVDEEVAEMRAVVQQACRHALGVRAPTVFDALHEVAGRQRDWAREKGLPPLLAQFGTSLVERALIDAYCRCHDRTLADVIRNNALGLRLSAWHPELADAAPADGLPAAPLAQVTCRHTVGLADPLEEDEAVDHGAPDDGLPVSLVAAIRAYRLHEFKLKVTADQGVERLERMVAVILRETGGRFAASLDGNESFPSVRAFRAFWQEAQARPGLAELWPRLLFVEQPFARTVALSDEVGRDLQAWSERPPLIIDESGAEPEDLRRALAGGYVGISHKNCKGVLHGVANACLLAQRRRTSPAAALIMSGEDLSNIGPVALPQDLAVQAVLGNRSVERNGHHYFAGLSGWPRAVGDHVLALYPDLYHRSDRGWPTLRVHAGELALAQVNARAFGGAAPDALRTPDAGSLFFP